MTHPSTPDATSETSQRREMLGRSSVECPNCGERWQVQLVDYLSPPPAKWKCRVCRHPFEWEPANAAPSPSAGDPTIKQNLRVAPSAGAQSEGEREIERDWDLLASMISTWERRKAQEQAGFAAYTRLKEAFAQQARDLAGNRIAFNVVQENNKELRRELAGLLQALGARNVKEAREKVSKQGAVIAKLPVTADGVIVIPEVDEVWHPTKVNHEKYPEFSQFVYDDGKWFVQDSWSYEVGGLDHYAIPVSECYSTQAAALRQREQQGNRSAG